MNAPTFAVKHHAFTLVEFLVTIVALVIFGILLTPFLIKKPKRKTTIARVWRTNGKSPWN